MGYNKSGRHPAREFVGSEPAAVVHRRALCLVLDFRAVRHFLADARIWPRISPPVVRGVEWTFT